MVDGTLSSPGRLRPLLRAALARDAALILVATGFSHAVLQALRRTAGLRCAAHEAPPGPGHSARLADLASVLGARVLTSTSAHSLGRLSLDQLGRARAARISGSRTVLHPDAGHIRADIRASELRARLAAPAAADISDELRDRLSFFVQAEVDAGLSEHSG